MPGIETEICKRYEAELAAIAALDRAYYLNATPAPADRASYVRRQAHLEDVRAQLYAELSTVRHSETTKPGMFRVLVNDRLIGQPVMSTPRCTLAHDLNNYLGVVIGRCELLADHASKDAQVARHSSAILDAARKMADLIRGSTCKMSNL
jgi:hypothetical protein